MVPPTDQEMRSIHRMLNPSSIAVVGATQRLQYGGRFLQNALRASQRVRVYPVNPRYDELMGLKCYPSVKDLPESPDVVGIIVPYARVMGILEDCAEKGAGSAIVISAGFAERGTEEGGELQRRIRDFARRSGVRVSGPNCLGVVNLKDDIWVTSGLLGAHGIPGPIALVSQSGASALGPFLNRALDLGIGYSYIVTTGNEADLGSSDFIRYLLDDVGTKVIACFVEGFNDSRKFMEVARLAWERSKPIVMIKIGRSEPGSAAARSHTAALTGSDAVHDAVFKQYGVIRVEDYDALLGVSQLLAFSPSPPAEGIAIVSHSGGIGSLAADKCGQIGLTLPPLREETRTELNSILKGFGWAANPADVTGYANSESFPAILDLMISEPEIGTLVVASSFGDSQAQQVIKLRNSTNKAVVFLWTGSQSATDGLPTLKESNIPVFYQPEGLAVGLRALLDYHLRRMLRKADGVWVSETLSREQADTIWELSSLERRTLTEHEAKGLLSVWDVPITRELQANNREDAVAAAREIGYPVVLKVESADILHKSEGGLVRVGISDEDELRAAYDTVISDAHTHFPSADVTGVLVQEMVEGGTEVIVGVSRDPQFGPVLLLGMGGIFVELYQDVALRVCPITRRDALEMIEEVKGARLLRGYRGRPGCDVDSLVEVLLRVSSLATSLQDELLELDINPLMVLPQGQGVKALDALAIMGRDSDLDRPNAAM